MQSKESKVDLIKLADKLYTLFGHNDIDVQDLHYELRRETGKSFFGVCKVVDELREAGHLEWDYDQLRYRVIMTAQ